MRSAARGRLAERRASEAERGWPSASRRSCSRPRSGSGVSESHSRITGSSCCISGERRVKPGVSSSSAARGALDVGEAERGEALLRGLGGQRAGPGERVEQRREEQPLVDRPHRGLVRAVVGLELLERGLARRGRGSRARARGACARASSDGSVWVCCSSRAAGGARRCAGTGTRRRAARRRRASTYPPADELRERVERRRATRTDGSWRPCTSWSSCTANSMSRMPPRPALQLAVGEALAARASPRCAPSSPGSRAPRPGRAPRATRTAARGSMNASPSVGVAGDRARLEQRLELPRLRPPLPVRGVAVERAASARPTGPRAAGRRRCGTRCRRRWARLIIVSTRARPRVRRPAPSPSWTKSTSTSLA